MTTTVTEVTRFDPTKTNTRSDRGEMVGIFDLHHEVKVFGTSDTSVHVIDATCVGYVQRDVPDFHTGERRDVLSLWRAIDMKYITIVGWENNQPHVVNL